MMHVEARLIAHYKRVDKRLGKIMSPSVKLVATEALPSAAKPSKIPSGLTPHERYVWKRCEEFGVEYDVIIGKAPSRDYTAIRQLIWYELHSKFKLSHARIGALMTNRHPSTILDGIHRITDRLESAGPDLLPDVRRLLDEPKTHDRIKAAYSIKTPISLIEARHGIDRRSIAHVAAIMRWTQQTEKSTEPRYRIAQMRREYYAGVKIAVICKRHAMNDKAFWNLRKKLGWEIRPKVQE
jgi:hypothetical protein